MPSFTAQNVREAFAAIRRGGIPEGFGPSTKWDIIDDATNERFPPKAVLFLAKRFATDESRSGGGGDRGTNNALRERGFSVVLKTALEQSQTAEDIDAVLASGLDTTTKQRLVNARLGQGGFRQALLDDWSGKCVLTKLDVEQALRASHIKAWRDATDQERLDPSNGLLLAATLDALFDKHLISLDDQGYVLVSSSLNPEVLDKIGLPEGVRVKLSTANRMYLSSHRQHLERNGGSTYRY
jgi:hypothetical protein